MVQRFIKFDEVAEMLGVTPEQLNDMRSRNEIHGYRDGSTWKFKPEEVQRVAEERGLSIVVTKNTLGIPDFALEQFILPPVIAFFLPSLASELGAFPHNITSSSVVLSGDYIFASTSNGVDWSHINIPAPTAAAIVTIQD